MSNRTGPTFLSDRTDQVIVEAARRRSESADAFAAAREMAHMLGAHVLEESTARFGFWTPELRELGVEPDSVVLELYLPEHPIDLSRASQTAHFRYLQMPTGRDGDYTWSVVGDVPVGRGEAIGALYRLGYTDTSGTRRAIVDPLAVSVPFGAAAPAELYDIEQLLQSRRDNDYFQEVPTAPDPDGVPRITAPVTMLEIHTPTATAGGTLAALQRHYESIGAKLEEGMEITDLAPSEQAILGYDAVQLMPIEPTILFERGEEYWRPINEDRSRQDGADRVAVEVRRPYSTNWGYDVITVASPAPNPVLLETGRPDELLRFIETLHTFPGGPIKVVLDVVYGHADNQAVPLLNHHFFAGANMYGQNLNYTHPVVRAILLEMQRRKSNFGVDGVRVDGAQDFKYWVPEEDALYHDDEYLRLMNDVVQHAAGKTYRPWMVFEDGRPWPRDDWELASTYREVTKQLPRVVQWGPLTFAHNTPFLFTFWINKWWRIREIMDVGAHWITGAANHDTLRRGTQVDPTARVNTYLGSSPARIFEHGYDNPAAHLFDVFVPGIPMDFLNANLRAPWSFVRNTDVTWAIKVVSEEARLLDWVVTPDRFARQWAFPRLKAFGFRSLDGLRAFQRALVGAVAATEYEPDSLAAILTAVRPRLEGPQHLDGAALRRFARAWMDDVHEFCNLAHYRPRLDADAAASEAARFAYRVRAFGRRERWTAGNLQGSDHLSYAHPTDGTVLFRGYRRRPETVSSADGRRPLAEVAPVSSVEELVFVANMEGAPIRITPREIVASVGAAPDAGWHPILSVPTLEAVPADLSAPLTLNNAQAVLYAR